jgi:hypothetical protein
VKEQDVSAAAGTPWYRQGWPWFLIAVPATAVIGGIVTAIRAARGFDGPVAADYYKQGLAINEEVARAQLAHDLALAAEVDLAGLADGNRVRVVLSAAQPLPREAAVRLQLIHPGRPSEDRVAVLALVEADADNRHAAYTGVLQASASAAVAAAPVTWQVILESPSWRIDDSFTAGHGGRFSLRAR